MNEKRTDVKLGFGKQLGFALGETAGQFFFGYWGTFLSIFYTDVVGIMPMAVSIIFIVARIWDAVNDPIMGNIADRHRHKKYGRYRPWILYGTPVLAILGILVWYVPKTDSQTIKIAYVAITYILAGMAFTAVNVPYMSLQSTLTTDPKSRSDLANLKGAFTFVGTAIINMFTAGLVAKLAPVDSYGQGYFLTTVIFTIIAVAMYYITFLTTKEVYIAEDAQSKASFKETIAYVFGNKPILAIMFGLLFSMLATFGRLGVAVYYYLYDLHAYEMVGVLMVLPTLFAILPTYLVPKINLERKKLIIIAFLGRAVALGALYFVDFANIKAVMVCLILVGLFNYETGMMSALIAPAIDDAEVKGGKRMDGTVFAMVNLFAKVASAVGGSIGLLVMGAMGYVANAEQTATAMNGINIAANVLPAAFCLIAILPIALYSLDSEKIQENTRILAERHSDSEKDNT